jgi:hypothetical protein
MFESIEGGDAGINPPQEKEDAAHWSLRYGASYRRTASVGSRAGCALADKSRTSLVCRRAGHGKTRPPITEMTAR